MNKKARIALWCFLVCILIVLISIMYFVFAAHNITTVGGSTSTSFNVNEDVGFIYNITVNNTDTVGTANITQVNITLSSGFTFIANSNGTNSSATGLFSNSSITNLSWINTTSFLVNATQQVVFWFNATASTPGIYNISVRTYNVTGGYETNLTVTVNDTTTPSPINFTGQTPATNSNLSQSNIPVNVTATDNGVIQNITARLYNATRVQINSSSSNSATSVLFFNFTNLADGTYYINATVNDTYGNNNNTETRTITLDTTSPIINLISPTNGNSTQNAPSVTFTFNVTDDSVISNCSLILNGAIVNINNSGINRTGGNTVFINNTYTVSNTWNVNCTDNTNNKANSSTYSFSLISFQFNGTARDEDGSALNASVINITIRSLEGWTVLAYASGTSNASGWFNFTVPGNNAWMYEPSIIQRNGTVVAFRSKSIPAFPSQMTQQLAGTTFYLTAAGTINITAINASGGRVLFQYQIKDTKLGYPIAEGFNTYATEVVINVPKNRNYSIMLYPNESMPVSFDWINFSSLSSYTIVNNVAGNISSYNATTSTLHKQFNLTLSPVRVTGYINTSYSVNWTNFTIIPFLFESGNMVHSQYGILPYNLSSAMYQTPQTDVYNLSSGFYNISLPGTAETSGMLLFATAVSNNSIYYGSFRNISLSYNANPLSLNFTMYGLLGTATNITMNRIDGQADIAIPTAKQTLNLVNSTNSTLSQVFAHIETTVDYSNYNATEFTWMSDIQQSQATATFSLTLLNVTGIKEMNVFAAGGQSGGGGENPGEYAPRRVSLTVSQIRTNNNITMRMFSPQDIDGALSSGQISIDMLISNLTCDVPNPPTSCSLFGGSSKNMNMSDPSAGFNPMQAIIGGGKLSFRMGKSSTGIFIHYVNVDMLASGPPDALFENDAGASESSSSFQNAVKFGSQGPTIYDYVLVSMPYSETAGSGLNDSAAVSINIPLFYDDNWGIIWNTTANGSSASALAGNYSHYSTYQNDWGNLTAGKTCTTANITTSSQINSSNPCYIDNSSNRIWIRLPHFSGTGPTVTGNIIAAAATTTTTPGAGGGTGAAANKTKSYSWTKITPGAATIWKLVDKDLGIKQISITVNNPAQNVQITITKYDGKPAEVTKEKSGKVYKYLKIEEKNLGKNLSKAIITIQVEKSWLTNKSLTKENISLFKFDGDWKEITTAYKEEDTTNYYYDTELTSFSYFAIAEKVEAAAVTCTPSWTCGEWSECAEGAKTRICTDSNTCGIATGKPAESETCGEEKKPILTKTTWAIIIGVVIAVIVIILIYTLYKKKR